MVRIPMCDRTQVSKFSEVRLNLMFTKGFRITVSLLLFLPVGLLAQDEPKQKNAKQFAELSYGLNSKTSVLSAGYYRTWTLSKSKKIWKNIYLGSGLRLNGFGGKNVYFVSSRPQLYKTKDEDSIRAPAPAIYSINTFLNLGYNFTSKWQAGFDIDVFGFSFGPNGSPTFISNGQEQVAEVNPTKINVLGVNANNFGSLLSNIYVRYQFTTKWGARLTYQKSYAEITTEEVLQTEPGINQRFRYVGRLIGLGVSYHF